MARVVVEVSRMLDAPAPAVYATLADYRERHPRILPRAFRNLVVERGGTGEGTIIRFEMKLGGTHYARAQILEPEPGRVLAEQILDERGTLTTFTVDPVGEQCNVTIRTEWNATGLRGRIEQWLAPRTLESVYREQLANLERVARTAL
jgi:hypothetical protein